MQIWEILEIEPTKDIREIKKAYSLLIKKYHPEDDVDAYERVRHAYEVAREYARSGAAWQENHNFDNNTEEKDTDRPNASTSSEEEYIKSASLDFGQIYKQDSTHEEQEEAYEENVQFTKLFQLRREVQYCFASKHYTKETVRDFLNYHKEHLEGIFIILLEADFYGMDNIEIYQLLEEYLVSGKERINRVVYEKAFHRIRQIDHKRQKIQNEKDDLFQAKLRMFFIYGHMFVLGILLSIILVSNYIETHWMNLEDAGYGAWNLYISFLAGLSLYQLVRTHAIALQSNYGLWSRGLRAYVYTVLPCKLYLFLFLFAANPENRTIGAKWISLIILIMSVADEIWFCLSINKQARDHNRYTDFFKKFRPALVIGGILLEISYVIVGYRMVGDVSGMSIIGIIILVIHLIRVYRVGGIRWINYMLHILAGVIFYQGIICSQVSTVQISEFALSRHEELISLAIIGYVFLVSINIIASMVMKCVARRKNI